MTRDEVLALSIERLNEECAKLLGWNLDSYGHHYCLPDGTFMFSRWHWQPTENWEHCGMVWDAMIQDGWHGECSIRGELSFAEFFGKGTAYSTGRLGRDNLKVAICQAAVLAMYEKG